MIIEEAKAQARASGPARHFRARGCQTERSDSGGKTLHIIEYCGKSPLMGSALPQRARVAGRELARLVSAHGHLHCLVAPSTFTFLHEERRSVRPEKMERRRERGDLRAEVEDVAVSSALGEMALMHLPLLESPSERASKMAAETSVHVIETPAPQRERRIETLRSLA